MIIPICIAIGHVADFMLDCFELLQVTETQIEIQHSQNCTVQFMCRQTGILWFILIEKGREKKG